MISPYIESIRDWKIKEMVAEFIRAKATFEKHCKRDETSLHVSFGTLRLLCDILFYIKEDHHQIFKRIINAKKHQFEDTNKFTPDEYEINFMNSVGLLFHKMMVARELTYMLDYYTEDSAGYQETKNSVDRNLQRINILFKQGAEVLSNMLKSKSQQKNVHLITYFLENPDVCTDHLNISLEKMVSTVLGRKSLEAAYLESAQFYADSGWPEKARSACEYVLSHKPGEKMAIKLLAQIEKIEEISLEKTAKK